MSLGYGDDKGPRRSQKNQRQCPSRRCGRNLFLPGRISVDITDVYRDHSLLCFLTLGPLVKLVNSGFDYRTREVYLNEE